MPEDKFAGSFGDWDFDSSPGPDIEVLRRTVSHEGGDITLNGPSGSHRLTVGTPTWKRYMRYHQEADIHPPLERETRRVTGDESFTIMKEVVLRVPAEKSVFHPMRPEIREAWLTMEREVRDIEAQGGIVDFEFPY